MPDINTINTALRAALEPALSKREEIVIRALLGAGEPKHELPDEYLRDPHGNIVGRIVPFDSGRLPEPVAQRELTDAEVEECARAGWEAVPASGPDGEGWMGCGVDREWWARMTRWTMRQEPGAPGFGAFDHAVLSKAAEIRARGSEQPAPRSAALDLTARMAEALNEAIDMRAATGGPVPVKWTVLLAEYAAEKKQ